MHSSCKALSNDTHIDHSWFAFFVEVAGGQNQEGVDKDVGFWSLQQPLLFIEYCPL